MADDYPVVTYRAPWAHAIIYLGRDVDNRTWAAEYRGWHWVHQGKAVDPAAAHLVAGGSLTLGAIIGAARITGVARASASPWAEPGLFQWELADAVYLPRPLYLRGQQNFFRHPATLELPDPESLSAAPLAPPGAGAPAAARRGAAVFSPDVRRHRA